MPFRRPTADTASIVAGALAEHKAIYRPGFNLAKAGVMLMELHSNAAQQCELDLKAMTGRTAESYPILQQSPVSSGREYKATAVKQP